MGTVRLGVFPSLNNKYFQDELAKSVCQWFINRFPNQFFNHVYLDTQTGNANNYIISDNNILTEVRSAQKILDPRIRMTIRQGRNNTDEVFGSLWNVNQQPGAHLIDTELTGYRPILQDPYGTILSINEYPIRNQIEISVSVHTKADQLAFLNMCDTNLKNLYVEVINTDTYNPLPQLLMEYLRSTVFKPEIMALERMVGSEEEKNEYKKSINEKFANYLYSFSEKHIQPFRVENEGVTDIVFQYLSKQRVTLKLDRADADDGERRGSVFSSFNITLSGWMEYGNPVSFITSVPAIIRGTKNNWYLKTSAIKNKKNYFHTLQFKEVFKDTRKKVAVRSDLWQQFYLEREVMMSAVHEQFNILDDIIDVVDTPSHYYIMRALLDTVRSLDDFKSLFKVIIYKNDEAISSKEYTIDQNFNFDIKNCDLSVPYYIEVFVNKYSYNSKMALITKKLNDIGVTIDWNESNSHITSSRGITYIPLETDASDITFIPIKQSDFLTIDNNLKYYILYNDNYIPVKDEVILARADMNYYSTVDGKEFIEMDRNKILIPDNKYKYYIYDRDKDKYFYVVDIQSFDPIQQYYIDKTQWKSNDIVNVTE